MSHTNLLFHIVFATKGRMPLLTDDVRHEMHAYLSGTIKNLGGKALAVSGTSDHVHLFIQLKAHHRLSDVMRELKANSSAWFKRRTGKKFAWQVRYGAFTVSQSLSPVVKRYIKNQPEYHRKKKFETEYAILLRLNEIHY
jgi:REP element-mobilizing transposase RayT